MTKTRIKPHLLRDRMDKKVSPLVEKLVSEGVGRDRIVDRLNADGVPYYRKLPIRYHFRPETPKEVLDWFLPRIRKRGVKYALAHCDPDFQDYYRPPKNPAPWTREKVQGLCRRMGIEHLTPDAYRRIAALKRELIEVKRRYRLQPDLVERETLDIIDSIKTLGKHRVSKRERAELDPRWKIIQKLERKAKKLSREMWRDAAEFRGYGQKEW